MDSKGVSPEGGLPDVILVLGSGGHGQVVLEAFGAQNGLDFFASETQQHYAQQLFWVVSETNTVEELVFGYSVLSEDLAKERFQDPSLSVGFLMGVGCVQSQPSRWEIFQRAWNQGWHPLSAVHSSAIVSPSAHIEPGCFIGPGAILHRQAVVGAASIVNSRAVVEHHVTIGHNSHVAPGAVVCGGVTVGNHSMIGAGAVVVQGITIVDGVTIGAGAVVTQSIDVAGTYVGVPAKKIADALALGEASGPSLRPVSSCGGSLSP